MTKKKKKIIKSKQKNNSVDETEFLRVLDNISKRLCHKFRFAYHDLEDMKQQAAIFALEGLKAYDNSRPLENFLWTHVRNRLFNFKRNNYQRPDKPCLTCPFFDKTYQNSLNQCTKYTDKEECGLFKSWNDRNTAKKNIVQPSYIENDAHASAENDLSNIIHNKEIIKFLDENIPVEYREYYLKLKHQIKIPKQQLEKLKDHINQLLESKLWKTKNSPKNEDS